MACMGLEGSSSKAVEARGQSSSFQGIYAYVWITKNFYCISKCSTATNGISVNL